jgi:hypothetical protein
MAFTADFERFHFPEAAGNAFSGKRVLITGSGKDGGIGQALALAAAANGAAVLLGDATEGSGEQEVLGLEQIGRCVGGLACDQLQRRDDWLAVASTYFVGIRVAQHLASFVPRQAPVRRSELSLPCLAFASLPSWSAGGHPRVRRSPCRHTFV